MSRLGRSQPVTPIVIHGFLGNEPPNGVLPPPIVIVVEPDNRRRRATFAPALVISGATLRVPTVVTFVAPPPPVVVPRLERPRANTVITIGLHGSLDDTPRARTYIFDRVDQRVRYQPMNILLVKGPTTTTTPTVSPRRTMMGVGT